MVAHTLNAFVGLLGAAEWSERLAVLTRETAGNARAAKILAQRHGLELTIERLRRQPVRNRPLIPVEERIAALAGSALELHDGLTEAGRERFRTLLRAALAGPGTLVPAFHLLRTAALQRSRGFAVGFAGLEDGAPFDLLLARNGSSAEVVCDVVSAEEGRDVHRGAWFRLVDRIDPELQTWLSAHPGRYLLKMTLPQGLREGEGGAGDDLAELHRRISTLLAGSRRADHDEAAVLRLDPLLLAGAQAEEAGVMSRLRREFGPEAHLAVTTAGEGVFVMAARAGRVNEVAAAVRRRMDAVAPARLTGTRPGILAMFVEDTDRAEWRALRDRLELEGEARQFLTHPEARSVVAVTCVSRMELFGLTAPDAVPDGDLRFRNPAHPAARAAALAPAVLSSV